MGVQKGKSADEWMVEGYVFLLGRVGVVYGQMRCFVCFFFFCVFV